MPEDQVVEIEQTSVKSEDKQEQNIPKHRFDQVNDRLNEYKDLGLSPTDIVELVTEYRNLVEKGLETKKPTQESKMDDARREELRKGLRDIAPEIDEIASLKEELKKTKATASTQELQQLQQISKAASARTKELFREAGFSTETYSKLYKKLEDAVANDIYTDAEKNRRYYSGDIDVVTETFEEYRENFLSHVPKPKVEEKDLSFLSGKKGLTLPASALDDKVKAGKPLTRDEMKALHAEVFSLMQGS